MSSYALLALTNASYAPENGRDERDAGKCKCQLQAAACVENQAASRINRYDCKNTDQSGIARFQMHACITMHALPSYDGSFLGN
jgi:hypothetical protein